MAINPSLIEIKKVTELVSKLPFLQAYFSHCGTDGVLYKATMNEMANFLSPFITAIGGSGFIPTTGAALPAASNGKYTIVGIGTFTQATGGSVTTTKDFNILGSTASTWGLVTELAMPTINPQGEWDASRADYNRLDWVTYGGSSYMAIWKNGNIPMGTPVTDKVYWEETAKGVDMSNAASRLASETITSYGNSEVNGYVNASGSFIASTNWITSVEIEVSEGDTVIHQASVSGTPQAVMAYSSDRLTSQVLLAANPTNVPIEVKVPAGWKYVIMSGFNTPTPIFKVKKYIVNKGNLPESIFKLTELSNYNLIPNTKRGLIFANLAATNATAHLETGFFSFVASNPANVTIGVVSDFQGFDYAAKISPKAAVRVDVYSSAIDLSVLPFKEDAKYNLGFFAKIPDNYTGTVEPALRNPADTTLIGTSVIREFKDMGNGWRYYRFKTGQLIPFASKKVEFTCLFNYTGSAATDIYFTEPVILQTENQTFPGIYKGIDKQIKYNDLSELTSNPVLQSDFSKAEVGGLIPHPWVFVAAGSGSGNFTAAYRVVNNVSGNPFSDKAIEIDAIRRSSDNYRSDGQFNQYLRVPTKYRGRGLFSVGAWFLRTSITTQLTFNIVPYLNDDFTSSAGATISNITPNLAPGEVLGQWVFVKHDNLALPAGTKSVLFSIRIYPNTIAPLDVVSKTYFNCPVIDFKNPLILGYNKTSGDESIKMIFGDLAGKKWVSYGHSFVAANGYQPVVAAKFGLQSVVRGVGGTSINENGSIAYFDNDGNYLARPPEAQPAGSVVRKSSLSNQERVDTIPVDAEIITIDAGVNGLGLPLGDIDIITDTTTDFYSACQIMFQRIQVRCPNAKILIMTPYKTKGDGTTYNTVLQGYREAFRKLGDKYGFPIIDVAAKSGVNQNNWDKYFLANDAVHPNLLANQTLIAPLIIKEFMQLYL